MEIGTAKITPIDEMKDLRFELPCDDLAAF